MSQFEQGNLSAKLFPLITPMKDAMSARTDDDTSKDTFNAAIGEAAAYFDQHSSTWREDIAREVGQWLRDANNVMGGILGAPRFERPKRKAQVDRLANVIGRLDSTLFEGGGIKQD